MPTKRFDNLSEERRKIILDSARKEFIDQGFNSASLNTVVGEAGISKGSLYYYFEDKEDLFIAVMEREINHMMELFGGIFTGEYTDDFWGDVDRLYRKSLKHVFENPDVVKLTREFHSIALSGRGSVTFNEFMEKLKSITRGVLQHGIEVGAVRTDLPLDLLIEIFTHMDLIFDMWILNQWEDLTQEEINRYYDIYFDMFMTMASRKSQKGGEE